MLIHIIQACVIVGAALGICSSLTPGFFTLNPTAQAKCLCYSSTSWNPGLFDNAVDSCANFASTAVPTAYSPLANLEGFCTAVGDVGVPASSIPETVTTILSITNGTSGTPEKSDTGLSSDVRGSGMFLFPHCLIHD